MTAARAAERPVAALLGFGADCHRWGHDLPVGSSLVDGKYHRFFVVAGTLARMIFRMISVAVSGV
jgi:hypothetical protein